MSSTTVHPDDAVARQLAFRTLAAVVCVACVGVLVFSASMTPSASGLGTHTQLGLPTCGWIRAEAGPCPTCGMTTAFALAAHGRLVESFLAQPAAALMALLIAMAAWISGYTALTGCDAVRHLTRFLRWRTFFVALALFIVAWIYKMASYG